MVSLEEEIISLLKNRKMSLKEIYAHFPSYKKPTIRGILSRGVRKGIFKRTEDGIYSIGDPDTNTNTNPNGNSNTNTSTNTVSGVSLETSLEKPLSLKDKFKRFFRRYYYKDILKICRSYPEKRSLVIDFDVLDNYDFSLAEEVINSPDRAIEAAEKAIRDMELPIDLPSVKINVRFKNISETRRIKVYEAGDPRNAGKLVTLTGVVRSISTPSPEVVIACFECAVCGNIMRISQEGEQLKKPYICDSCERKGPFKLLVDETVYTSIQKLAVQDPFELVEKGIPGTVEVILRDDLCSMEYVPGTYVEIVAIPRFVSTKYTTCRYYLEAVYIEKSKKEFEAMEITPEDEKKIKELAKDERIFEKIANSIAPHIKQRDEIKKGLALALASPHPFTMPDGSVVRGDIHIIMIGEPATGKSSLMDGVQQIAPKSYYTSGEGSTKGGLGVAAVKDERGGFVLSAGALVLANNGILLMDEMDKIERSDLEVLHTPMEKQQLPVSKAGVYAVFPSKCSIIAACNPKYGRFDEYRAISEQVEISPALLSRFDLIFLIRDDPEESEPIVRSFLTAIDNSLRREKGLKADSSTAPPLDTELLRKYIAYVKKLPNPLLSEEAKEELLKFYLDLRKVWKEAKDTPVQITIRQLSSLVRLMLAHARLRLKTEADREDFTAAKELLLFSLKQAGLDPETGEIDIDKIMVGVTKSQRDKIRTIMRIIGELEEEFGTAKKEEIIDMAKEHGIPEDATKEMLEKLKRSGDIYEPRNNRFRTTS